MSTNECNNDGEVAEATAADSTANESASPSAEDVSNDPSPPEQKVEKEGADTKTNEELLLNVHDSSNDNVEEPTLEKEVVTETVEEEEAPSMIEDAVAASQNEVDTTNDENENENDVTPPPPKVDQELVKQLHTAIESYEQMRRVNLEMEYSSATPSLPPCMAVNHERCTYCQREAWERFILNPTPMDDNARGGGINIGALKLDGSRIKTLDGRRIRRLRNNVGNFFARQNNENTQSVNDNNEAREEDDGLFVKATDGMDDVPKEEVDGTVSASGSNSFEGESVKSNTEADSIEIESSQSNSFEGESGNSSTKPQRKRFLQRKHPPCLTCGHPVCGKHQSSTFSTSNIRVCEPCARLFELDFLVDVITTTASNTAECRKQVNQMVDCYDRAKLLLLFTSQYTDQIAAALEQSTARSNKIGVGSSATGIVSGMAGVVGCGALLFPPAAAVGIPLLVSSLVFGGAATAAQTGDAAAQYFSEPNKLADKMVTLHAMMLSLLRISEVLSNGLLKDHDYLDGDVDGKRRVLAEEINALLKKHGVAIATEGVKGLSTAMIGGAVAAEAAVAGAELSATSIATASATVAGRSSRFFGRVGTTAASGARFIPIAGGLLSAACVVVEGKELKKTVARINEGNPCAKAEQIRSIRDEIEKFPDSSVIADDCRRVFEIAEKECAFF